MTDPPSPRSTSPFEARAVTVREHTGGREELRSLFALAEDSADQLDTYMNTGRVLVAESEGEIVGHLQLVDRSGGRSAEIKNMAVAERAQRRGVGRRLVEAARAAAHAAGRDELLVATAACDIGNLRFYQRVGFRMLSVERDAFTAATGYPQPIVIDGIPLRDRVWLSAP